MRESGFALILYIQILRLFAALWVALYHAQNFSFYPQLPRWLQTVAQGGYAGVDIFFVISGVIMALVTSGSPQGAKPAAQFVLTRFARIYTGWWPAMLLFYVALGAIGALPGNVNLVASALLYPSNFSLHISSVIWTLVFELYFYLLIGASLLLPKRWRDPALAMLAFVIFVTVLVNWGSGAFTPEAFGRATMVTWFFAGPLVLEFFAGYFVYRLIRRSPLQDWRPWAAICLALITMAAYASWQWVPQDHNLAEFYYWPERAFFIGLAACALVGTAILAPLPQQRSLQWLAKLGDYSFAIYLLHLLLYQVLQKLLAGTDPSQTQRLLLLPTAMLALLSASALYYCFIEHPIYQACRLRISKWLSTTPSTP